MRNSGQFQICSVFYTPCIVMYGSAKSRSFFLRRPFSFLLCRVLFSTGLVEIEKPFHMTPYFGLYTLHDYYMTMLGMLYQMWDLHQSAFRR